MSDPIDIYTNSVRVSVSLYEVALSLALMTSDGKGEISSRDLAIIRMSPQHAASLNALLTKHLSVYSNEFKMALLPDEIRNQIESDQGVTPNVKPHSG